MKNQIAWALCLLVLFIFACKAETNTENADADGMAADTTAMAPAEFADQKYADMVRSGMDGFTRKDVASWLGNYSDNAVYLWNNGDSLAGKAAITDYWTKRMTNVIDSISVSNGIYLPVKVNKPQSIEQPGIWVLGWHMVTASYTTGKSMTQWVHVDYHFDANDKIDRAIHYVDRQLIIEATTK